MYASNAIEVVGGTVDPELGDLAASYKKPLSDLQKRSFYEGIGWDFVNVWSYPEGTLYPVLKFKEGDVSGLETVQKVNVMNVSATGGNIIIETKKLYCKSRY